jgi:FkbM family methyltransferase
MTFYSQEKQDEYLETTIFKGFKNGFFMDVGAHDGVSLNNTFYFEKNNNWTGINIEPIKLVYNKLVENRPNCINLNLAVCNNDGEADFIRNSGYTEMLSGLKYKYNDKHKKRIISENSTTNSKSYIIKVNTKKIETITDEYNIKHINYLSIDVEGAEFDVIKSINFDKLYIDVIGFESNYEEESKEIILYLQSKGYNVIYQTIDIFMIHENSQFCLNISS